MKKYTAICCTAVMLCGTLIAAAACTERDPTVKGDYTRPTEEELRTALGAIDEEKLFGNAAAQGGGFGFSLGGDFEIAADAEACVASLESSIRYDYSHTKDARAGSGSFTLSARGEETDPENTEDGGLNVNVSLYNDADAAYAYVTAERGETRTEAGGKLSFPALAAAAGAYDDIPLPEWFPLAELTSGTVDIEDAVGALLDLGMDAWTDNSDGFKLKLVANERFYESLAADAQSYGMQLTYTQQTFEIYLHIRQDGLLEQFSSLIDIQGDVGEGEEAGTLSIGGNFVLRYATPRVTLPDELADSVKYPLYDDLFISADPEEPDDPEPQPGPVTVLKPQTTADGVVTAQNFNAAEGANILYDATADRVCVVTETGYKIYDAASRNLLDSDSVLQNIVCADVRGGKLYLGMGEKGIDVIDLKNLTASPAHIVTASPVYSIAATNSCIVFGTSLQWGAVMRIGFTGEGETRLLNSVYDPEFLVGQGGVYVIENRTPTATICKIDLAENTSEIFNIANTDGADADISLDGEYLHFNGSCYDADTMELVSSSGLAELYPETTGYPPAETLLITERYSYLRGTDGTLLIYDRSAEAFRYRAEFTPDTLYERTDGTIYAVCAAAGWTAIVDPAEFPKRTVAPDDPTLPDHPVHGNASLPQSTKDGILTVQTFYATKDSLAAYDAATDSYIVAETNAFRVYDMKTGELRFSEELLLDITCLDAYNGKLCLGLGEAKKIRVVDLMNGQYEDIAAAVAVSDIAVMNSCIVYADGDQWCSVYRVGFAGERETLLLSTAYFPVLTPNRSEGLVYVAETGLSDCSLYFIRLSDGTTTEVSQWGEFSYAEEGARFDGEAVYFCGVRFDAATGERLSANLTEDYLPAFGTVPEEGILLTEEYAFLRTQTGIIAVYDRAKGSLLYRTGIAAEAVYKRADGTFVLLSKTSGCAIVFDPEALPGAPQ